MRELVLALQMAHGTLPLGHDVYDMGHNKSQLWMSGGPHGYGVAPRTSRNLSWHILNGAKVILGLTMLMLHRPRGGQMATDVAGILGLTDMANILQVGGPNPMPWHECGSSLIGI